ncbi:MAG: hypothetical protein MN733_14975 [Nitrososphaera sp.]|nr:hypothetical protein [Nitrososphaera sp.]
MDANLTNRFNEGIVPEPKISADIPKLALPSIRPTPEQIADAHSRLGQAIIVAGMLMLFLMVIMLLFGVGLYVWLVP